MLDLVAISTLLLWPTAGMAAWGYEMRRGNLMGSLDYAMLPLAVVLGPLAGLVIWLDRDLA